MQILRPDRDISNEGKFLIRGGNTLFDALQSNTAFIYQNNGGAHSCMVGMSAGVKPGIGEAKIEWLSLRTAGSVRDGYYTMFLYEGSELRAQSPKRQVLHSSYAWTSYILTPAEVTSIQDWSKLQIRITKSIEGIQGDMSLRLRELKMTIPDADISPPVDPPIDPPPVEGEVKFHADFESGTLAPYTASNIFGKPDGKWSIRTVNSPAIGNYSAELSIQEGTDVAAYLFPYTVLNEPVGTYIVNIFIKSGAVLPSIAAGWFNISQHKSKDHTYPKPVVSFDLIRLNNIEQLCINHWTNGQGTNPSIGVKQKNPIPFPRDKWVELRSVFKTATDNTGYVILYQDGVEIGRIENIMTKPGGQPMFWSVQAYSSPKETFSMYVDEIRMIEGANLPPVVEPPPVIDPPEEPPVEEPPVEEPPVAPEPTDEEKLGILWEWYKASQTA